MTEMGNYQPLGPFGEEAPFRTDLAPIPGLSPSRYAVRPTVPGKVIELVNVSGELDTYVESASELKGFLGYLDERYNIPSVEL